MKSDLDGLKAYCEVRLQIEMWKAYVKRSKRESHYRLALQEIASLNRMAAQIYRFEFNQWAECCIQPSTARITDRSN